MPRARGSRRRGRGRRWAEGTRRCWVFEFGPVWQKIMWAVPGMQAGAVAPRQGEGAESPKSKVAQAVPNIWIRPDGK